MSFNVSLLYYDVLSYFLYMQDIENMEKDLSKLGGQYATTTRFRHPTQKSFVIAKKGIRDIFDLAQTTVILSKTLDFIKESGKKGNVILFVSSHQETLDIIENLAKDLSLPFMTGRWIGGTLSNFKNIHSRVERMIKLQKEKEDGSLTKFTKKERVLLDRELLKLQNHFGGIESLDRVPSSIFIVDTKREEIATKEANLSGVPVIGFSSADADLHLVQHPIIANIYSRQAVEYIASLVSNAYKSGVLNSSENK